MSDAKKNLLLFFDRPNEPCFMQKGDEKTVFRIPDHYYPDKYKSLKKSLINHIGLSKVIAIRAISLPDLALPLQLGRQAQFSLFVPQHRQMAARLVDIFMGMSDLEDLQSICSYSQLHINPFLFNYCLSVALLHRPDTKGLQIPTFVETFPHKFMDPKVFHQAWEMCSLASDETKTSITIPVNYTASEREPEHFVAYFREDIGINLHHWHWHLVYPHEAADVTIVNKDRRGELFYYMHQQILCRYNAERLCNGMERVRSFNNFREPIAEGYFPKLDCRVSCRAWPPRFANTKICDVDRPEDKVKNEISELETWRDRFLDAVESQSIILPDGSQKPLSEEAGIDILGNLMESSILSLNRAYYGDLHNVGHVFISYCHDPDNRHLEQFGVMGDTATAMRDPIFYRWHACLNDIFTLYKSKLPPYTVELLNFPGISVSSVSIEGPGGKDSIGTLWERSTVELGRGLDFTPRGSVLARFTHLQHQDFNYVIEVTNNNSRSNMGTFRIFLGPTVDERGQPLPFDEQRRLMIEMDKFSQPLRAGKNTVRRRSIDSSVTIPYERTFRDQSARPGDPGSAAAAEFDFCGCGWPHHMLAPKGNSQGYPMVLFVMVSNWNDDRIEQDLVGACNDAASYCGIRDRKYPDRRPMGFPFDRRAPGAVTIGDFLQPNMAVLNCTVKFTDRTRDRGQE